MDLSIGATAWLEAVVLLAFIAQTATGFGSALIAVTLGAVVVPIETLLPAFIPVNMALSLYTLVADRRQIATRALLAEIAPFVGCGLILGLLAFRWQATRPLQLGFGLFVTGLALTELRALARARGAEAPGLRPLAPTARALSLAMGGFIHGLFGAGGPLIVSVLRRRLVAKGALRASLACVWVSMNVGLVANYASLGLLDAPTTRRSLALLAVLPPGLWLGNRLHHRLDPRRFQVAVSALLFFAGVALTIRSGLSLRAL